MSVLGRLFGKTDRALAAKEASTPATTRGWEFLGSLGSPWVAADGAWQSYSPSDLEQAYRKCSLVYACVRELATTAAEAPLIVRPDEPDSEPMPNHWLAQRFKRPNDYYSRSQVIIYFVERLMLTGASCIWKLRNAYEISELWPIPTSWVTPQTGAGTELFKSYKIKQGAGREIEIDAKDMLYEFLADPQTTHSGLGPMQAATRDYQTDMERGDYLIEMLTNLKVPGLVVHTETPLTPDQKAELKASLHDQIGKGKRGEPLTISGPNAGVDLLNPLADLDMPGLSMMSESRICMTFGVPPILVGARVGLEHATYANYGEARESFYKETMRPLWTVLGDGFTRGLLVAEGETGLIVEHDLSNIPELQDDQNKAAERAVKVFGGGLATRNESRALAGLPEIEGDEGKVFLIPTNATERFAGELAEDREADRHGTGDVDDGDEDEDALKKLLAAGTENEDE